MVDILKIYSVFAAIAALILSLFIPLDNIASKEFKQKFSEWLFRQVSGKRAELGERAESDWAIYFAHSLLIFFSLSLSSSSWNSLLNSSFSPNSFCMACICSLR